jgi:hypothetical protein
MLSVTNAAYEGDFRIRVAFSDGATGCIDLGPLVTTDHREIVRELADRERFRRFSVAMDTIVWENGFDLAPEYLRQRLMPVPENSPSSSEPRDRVA